MIEGGTHVEWSPTVHYLRDVLFPLLSKIGIKTSLEIDRWGWYPGGGGSVCLHIEPAKRLSPIDITERGKLTRITALSAVSNLPLSIAERQRDRALRLLQEKGLDAEIEIVEAPSPGKGTLFFMLTEFDNIR
ncbi:MAG: RNA 3'-phosphate cyclase, partial [Proteobacteria bacterium]|nr:RNA 3'-phosphate cyclase [Pseudomonadota bacterium]